MRVLWVHNFDPNRLNAGCFVKAVIPSLQSFGVIVDLYYLGNLRSPKNLMGAIKKLKEISTDYDIVHAQYGSICSLITSFVNKPKVVTIRGNDWTVHNETISFPFFHTRISRFLTRISINRFDGVIPVSNRLKKEVETIYRQQIELVLPSPIDLSVWRPKIQQFENNSKKKHKVLFVSLNKKDPIKRYAVANEALDILNKRLDNVVLSVASNIPYEEMPSFVADHDVVLCLSETEGWPNSVKEALACNIPFVATDVSDLKEIADKEKVCVITELVPEVIADNLFSVLTVHSSYDVRKYVEDMDVEVSAKKLIKLYNSILRK